MVYTLAIAQANRSTPAAMPPQNAPSPSLGASAADTIPIGTTECHYRLVSSNWPTGSADFIEWVLDRDDLDGNGWRDISGQGVTPEGAKDHHGNMPGIYYNPGGTGPDGMPLPLDHEINLRVRYRISGTLRFGVERELVP